MTNHQDPVSDEMKELQAKRDEIVSVVLQLADLLEEAAGFTKSARLRENMLLRAENIRLRHGGKR